MNIWFTSDTHYNHTESIVYFNRPFQTVEEMNRTIVTNLNAKVESNDQLYILGDVCWGDSIQEFRDKLACKTIYVLLGDHDRLLRSRYKHLWNGTYDILDREFNGNKFKLCHYPLENWDNPNYKIMLHGHSHGKSSIKTNRIDVGVDGNRFSPYSLEDILEIIRIRKNVPPTETKPIETSEDQNV